MTMTLCSGAVVSEHSVRDINKALLQLMCSQLQKQYGVSIPNLMKHDIHVPFVEEIIKDACTWVECQEWTLYQRCLVLMKQYRDIALDVAIRDALAFELNSSGELSCTSYSEAAHRIVNQVKSTGFNHVETSVILARLTQIPTITMKSLFFSELPTETLDKYLDANGVGTSFIEILEVNPSLFREWSFSRNEMFYIACSSADNHLHEIDKLLTSKGI